MIPLTKTAVAGVSTSSMHPYPTGWTRHILCSLPPSSSSFPPSSSNQVPTPYRQHPLKQLSLRYLLHVGLAFLVSTSPPRSPFLAGAFILKGEPQDWWAVCQTLCSISASRSPLSRAAWKTSLLIVPACNILSPALIQAPASPAPSLPLTISGRTRDLAPLHFW